MYILCFYTNLTRHLFSRIKAGGVDFVGTTTVVDLGHTRHWLKAGWQSKADQPILNVNGNVSVVTSSGVCLGSFNTSRGDRDDLNVTCMHG